MECIYTFGLTALKREIMPLFMDRHDIREATPEEVAQAHHTQHTHTYTCVHTHTRRRLNTEVLQADGELSLLGQ